MPALPARIAMVLTATLLAGCGPKLATSRPMPPGVVTLGAIRRYQVHGSTVAEIARSLREDRPMATEGFVGYHSYQLRWTYQYQDTRGSCRFTQVRVEVHSAIDAPEWQRPADAGPELVALWDRYIAALDEHERGHERIAIEGAGEIARMFQRAQEMSCMTLRTDADREAQRLSRAMQERQRQFDLDTRHGTLAGARWPPAPPSDSTP